MDKALNRSVERMLHVVVTRSLPICLFDQLPSRSQSPSPDAVFSSGEGRGRRRPLAEQISRWPRPGRLSISTVCGEVRRQFMAAWWLDGDSGRSACGQYSRRALRRRAMTARKRFWECAMSAARRMTIWQSPRMSSRTFLQPSPKGGSSIGGSSRTIGSCALADGEMIRSGPLTRPAWPAWRSTSRAGADRGVGRCDR